MVEDLDLPPEDHTFALVAVADPVATVDWVVEHKNRVDPVVPVR